MADINRSDLETLVRKILLEELATKDGGKKVSKAGVASIALPGLDVRPEDRLDTGDASHQVADLRRKPKIGLGSDDHGKDNFPMASGL